MASSPSFPHFIQGSLINQIGTSSLSRSLQSFWGGHSTSRRLPWFQVRLLPVPRRLACKDAYKSRGPAFRGSLRGFHEFCIAPKPQWALSPSGSRAKSGFELANCTSSRNFSATAGFGEAYCVSPPAPQPPNGSSISMDILEIPPNL